MNGLAKLLTGSALALSVSVASCAQDSDERSEADTVTGVLEAYSNALLNEDVAQAEIWVLPEGTDFTIFEGSGSNIGWADYRDHHLAPEFAAEGFDINVYDWSEYSVQMSRNMAVATFSSRMEYVVRDERRERDGHGTAVLIRTENGWRISHLHTS